MTINRIDTEIGNYDLTVTTRVLAAISSETKDTQCQVYVEIGDGTNNLDGSGGIFELTLKINGQNVQPAPQSYEFGLSPRASIKTNALIIPMGQTVQVYIKSPNAADTLVAVKAYLFEIPQVDSVELVLDPDDLRTALSSITIPNQRVILGPCQEASAVRIIRSGCGVVSIARG